MSNFAWDSIFQVFGECLHKSLLEPICIPFSEGFVETSSSSKLLNKLLNRKNYKRKTKIVSSLT